MEASNIGALWILLRSRGDTRRFLKISVAARDGSLYLTLGDPHRNARVARGQITIPAGETSASTDYTKHLVANFTNFDGEHTGFKASGRVIHRFGDKYHPLPLDIPPRVLRDTLLQTIYPASLDTLPVTAVRSRDLVAPDHFHFRPRAGDDMEALFGNGPFHVDVWQMAAESLEAEASPAVLGAFTIKAGERQLVIAFVQDDVDRQRGWLPGGTRVLVNLASGRDHSA